MPYDDITYLDVEQAREIIQAIIFQKRRNDIVTVEINLNLFESTKIYPYVFDNIVRIRRAISNPEQFDVEINRLIDLIKKIDDKRPLKTKRVNDIEKLNQAFLENIFFLNGIYRKRYYAFSFSDSMKQIILHLKEMIINQERIMKFGENSQMVYDAEIIKIAVKKGFDKLKEMLPIAQQEEKQLDRMGLPRMKISNFEDSHEEIRKIIYIAIPTIYRMSIIWHNVMNNPKFDSWLENDNMDAVISEYNLLSSKLIIDFNSTEAIEKLKEGKWFYDFEE